MSIIEMPLRARRIGLAKQEPATVVKHPSVPHDFAAEAIEQMRADALKREADQEADRQLSIVFRDLEMIALKAHTLAGMHSRQVQVVTMFESIASKLRTDLSKP